MWIGVGNSVKHRAFHGKEARNYKKNWEDRVGNIDLDVYTFEQLKSAVVAVLPGRLNQKSHLYK